MHYFVTLPVITVSFAPGLAKIVRHNSPDLFINIALFVSCGELAAAATDADSLAFLSFIYSKENANLI